MKRAGQYNHKEAYCLMKYASKDGQIVEWLWNSRDGVTPFIIRAADGVTELRHTDFHLDRYLPGYQPLPGERIFVDSTAELMRPRVVAFVEQHWDNPAAELPERFTSHEQAISVLLSHWHQPGAPMVITAREWKEGKQ